MAYFFGRMHNTSDADFADNASWVGNRVATDDEVMLAQRIDEIAWQIAHEFSDDVTHLSSVEKAQLRAIISNRVLGGTKETITDGAETHGSHARSATG